MIGAAVGLALWAGAAVGADGGPLGQWVWSRADVGVFARERAVAPQLERAVFVATIEPGEDAFDVRFALAPRVTGDPPEAVVIRMDDALHAAWAQHDDAWMRAHLEGALARAMARIDGAGGAAAAVQLDYDCPVRRLERWAAVVRATTAPGGALAGRSVWITSLPAHLRADGFGGWFAGAVAGHVLQVFDTGEVPALEILTADLTRHGLPFRIGVGAFERRRPDGQTDHRQWFAAVPRFAALPGYRGVWVFPGGTRWLAAWRQAR